MTPDRELHIGYNVLGAGMHPGAWRTPYAEPFGSFDPRQWLEVAAIAERGTLDAVFIADGLALGRDIGRMPHRPPYDPTVLLSYLAGRTERIGLVATVSTSWEEPFNVARRTASLDHLSHGRAAWNVVTTTDPAAAQNFGAGPLAGRQERYERAEEFIDVVVKLWDSWDDDALIGDRGSGRFADADRIRPVDHHGAHFDVAGPLNVHRPPQGRPVIFQAGGSPAGLELAARSADAVFAALASLPYARAFADDLRGRAVRHGRPADSIRIMPGLCFVLGGTEAEARRRYDELNELAGENRLARLAGQLGVDADALDWDQPLPGWLLENTELSSRSSQGAREVVLDLARRERLTVRQILDRVITWHRLFVGTPEQMADDIQEWFESGAVDGFNIMPDVNPSGIAAFVDHVVPLLRARGLFRREYRGTTLREHLGLPRLARYGALR